MFKLIVAVLVIFAIVYLAHVALELLEMLDDDED
jgi:hypothetical protein